MIQLKLAFEGPVHQTRKKLDQTMGHGLVFLAVVVALVCVCSQLQFLKLYIYFEPTKSV